MVEDNSRSRAPAVTESRKRIAPNADRPDPLSAVLVGGSGSTGSSLLRMIINRHQSVFSGEELNFFNKEQLFENWNGTKHRLFGRFRRLVATSGWFPYPGHGLLLPEYLWQRGELEEAIASSNSIVEFSNRFFSRPVQKYGASVWIEKTPSNAYSFQHFLNAFPGSGVVHMTRQPLDATASLVRRGMSPFFAASLCFYNTACAEVLYGDPRYHLVRYEELTSDPEGTVQALCRFLGVPFDSRLLNPDKDEDPEGGRNPGWRYSCEDQVRAPAKSTFDLLPKDVREQLLGIFGVLRISDKHARSRGMPFLTPKDLFEHLGYELPESSTPSRLRQLTWTLPDLFHRSINRFPSGGWNYPLRLGLRRD